MGYLMQDCAKPLPYGISNIFCSLRGQRLRKPGEKSDSPPLEPGQKRTHDHHAAAVQI